MQPKQKWKIAAPDPGIIFKQLWMSFVKSFTFPEGQIYQIQIPRQVGICPSGWPCSPPAKGHLCRGELVFGKRWLSPGTNEGSISSWATPCPGQNPGLFTSSGVWIIIGTHWRERRQETEVYRIQRWRDLPTTSSRGTWRELAQECSHATASAQSIPRCTPESC